MSRGGRIISRVGTGTVRKWTLRFGVVFLLCSTIAALWLGWFLHRAPLPEALRSLEKDKPLTSLFLDVKGRLIAELPGPEARSHRPLPLDEMGPWLPSITVALEDQRFQKHWGIDFIATARAVIRRHGGGSTITEQLVKLATARKGRSLWVKMREMLFALQLERRWSKEEILEAYLNRVPYGNRMIGVDAASQAYFGKPATTLTRAESIYLAGLPQAPTQLNPWTHPENATQQFARSVKLLAKRGALLAGGLDSLRVPIVEHNLPKNNAPHFIEALLDSLAESQGAEVPNSRPLGVFRCTLDLDLQRQAQQWVRDHLNTLHRDDISEGAMVIMDNATGAVVALVGSRDFHFRGGEGEINGALSYRNCGSTLKPFLYLTGIDRKVFTAATLLPDTADAVRGIYPDYDPHNFVLNHLGPVRIREALGNSLNVPAVVALSQVGARTAFDSMAQWGLKFDHSIEEVGAGFILGNVGVRLLDLTSAFSGLARGGLAAPPQFLEGPLPIWRRTASPQAVEIITDILCDDAARFHSFGANSPLSTPVRVGVKTGTSTAFRDTWAVGFTHEHTVGVWVGNFDGRPMDHAASIVASAPLWRMAIDELLERDHPVPEPRLPRTMVCSLTGLLPCAQSPGRIGELFLPGSEPKESAEKWFGADGHPYLPQEYAGWCVSGDNFLKATVRPDLDKLAILNPREKAIFLIDQNLSQDQQQMEFHINTPEGTKWTINGAPLPMPANGRLLWPLKQGEWTLEAVNGEQRVSRHFSVKK